MKNEFFSWRKANFQCIFELLCISAWISLTFALPAHAEEGMSGFKAWQQDAAGQQGPWEQSAAQTVGGWEEGYPSDSDSGTGTAGGAAAGDASNLRVQRTPSKIKLVQSDDTKGYAKEYQWAEKQTDGNSGDSQGQGTLVFNSDASTTEIDGDRTLVAAMYGQGGSAGAA